MIKFTKGERNLMKEFHLDSFSDEQIFSLDKTHNAVNYVSRKKVQLNEFMLRLFIKVMTEYRMYAKYAEIDPDKCREHARNFDRLKYLFLKLDADAYYDLID